MPSVRLDKKSFEQELPDTPGVYFFRGTRKKILYIGKATSLRDRVRSYFGADLRETRGPLVVKMRGEAKTVDFVQTDSVLEALILEANLIKKHKPRYNSIQKDDKSFNYIVFTNEPYPAVRVMRGRDISFLSRSTIHRTAAEKLKAVYGPFPHGGQFKEAMKIIRKIFPFRDSCLSLAGKPCFNRQIGLCPGVCTGEISKKEYGRLIRHLELFFEGKKKRLLRKIEQDMKAHAKREEFEQAGILRKRIFALQHIQDVSLLKSESKKPGTETFRIESYDIAHLGGGSTVGVMAVVENGEIKKTDYRKFKLRGARGADDTGALAEVLTRRLAHTEWPIPELIVVDGGKQQKNRAEKVLRERKFFIPVVSVVKDERHRPREILGEKEFRLEHEKEILLANNEAHRFAISYHRTLRRKAFM